MTGDELRLWREGNKLSKKRCATLLGITRVTLTRYEGDKDKNLPKLVRWAIWAITNELEIPL